MKKARCFMHGKKRITAILLSLLCLCHVFFAECTMADANKEADSGTSVFATAPLTSACILILAVLAAALISLLIAASAMGKK